MKRSFIALFIAMILVFTVLNITVAASSPDPDKEITLDITVKSGENTVSGGAVTLYRVAELCEDMTYSYAEDFAECGISLDEDRELLCSELVAYVGYNGINGARRIVDEMGNASYRSLEAGLYLVIQDIAANGYERANPFVIDLPMPLEGGEYDYTVQATAKTEPEGNGTQRPVTTPSVTTRPGGSLPQTGQLKWPIPILIVCGLGLVIIGVIIIKSRKNEKDEK